MGDFMLEESKIIAELIPESTKEELLNPSAKLVGQALSGVLHFFLDPLVKLNVVRNQEIQDFEQKIISKNEEIPIENRDGSKKYLALKAIEDAKFQLDSEELREMFANLISSSLDSRKNNLVQPSFSSILRDLSPEDAQTLLYFKNNSALPLVDIRFESEDSSIFANYLMNIILVNNDTIQRPISITSLERLGLISVVDSKLQSPSNLTKYESFISSETYIILNENLPFTADGCTFTKLGIIEKAVQLTPLGTDFINIVS